MLSPKRVKFRKRFKGRTTGLAHRGSEISFGTYGLQTLEPGWITARQIEAARVALTRHIKRAGNVGGGGEARPGDVRARRRDPRNRDQGDGAGRGQDAGKDKVRGPRGGA